MSHYSLFCFEIFPVSRKTGNCSKCLNRLELSTQQSQFLLKKGAYSLFPGRPWKGNSLVL
jgi:hypothetical protein